MSFSLDVFPFKKAKVLINGKKSLGVWLGRNRRIFLRVRKETFYFLGISTFADLN